MEDKKSELLQYAREYATANKDLYELLSVPSDAAQPEVHRAWRKASLKHHPDKAKNFDPEIWQLFERARDVLSSPEARAAYDSARAAAVQAQKARAALDAKKRAMIDDLEARERGVKRKGEGEMAGRHMMTAAEKRVLMEKGREHLEKRRRMKEEAEAREREREHEHERERTRTGEEDAQSRGAARRDPERRPTQPDAAQIPASTTSANNETEDTDTKHSPPDEYDERIADLERKLRERKAEKAARRAGKKRDKARRDANNNNIADEDGEATAPPARTTTTTPPLAATTEKLASLSTSIPPPPQQQQQQQPPLASNPAPGDFSSTMAKLRAAQREKERKRAEAAAMAAASDGNR